MGHELASIWDSSDYKVRIPPLSHRTRPNILILSTAQTQLSEVTLSLSHLQLQFRSKFSWFSIGMLKRMLLNTSGKLHLQQ